MIGISQNIPSRKAEIPIPKEVCLVELPTSPLILLCCVDVPPSCDNSFHSEILSFLTSLSTFSHLIIVGDFNSQDINWNTLSGTSPFSISLYVIYSSLLT